MGNGFTLAAITQRDRFGAVSASEDAVANQPQKDIPKGLGSTLKASALEWSEHGSARTGAALAYYSVFSLGPLIVICIAIAGLVFDRSLVQKEVTESLRGLLGDKGSEAVNSMLDSAGKPSEGFFAILIGSITLAFAAIGVVVQLKDALNTIWGVTNPPGRGLWGFIRAHVFSLAAVLAAGFLLLISMLMTAALGALGNFFGSFVPESLLHATTVVVSFGVIALLFMLMFRYLPDAEVEWRDVWLGGLLTAALFELGRFAIGFYIGRQGLESTYGASASIVIVLIWVYYSAQIVLFGAEFTHMLGRERGYVEPEPRASLGG